MPVTYVELTPDEERLVLATLLERMVEHRGDDDAEPDGTLPVTSEARQPAERAGTRAGRGRAATEIAP